MTDKQLSNLFLDQSNDLIWMVDADFLLTYANRCYLNLMKQVTGKDKKLNEPVLVEGFGDGYIEKWKAYYERGLNGEHFEIEEHFYNPNTDQVEYSQISFNPLMDENQIVVSVACQSRDITSFVKSNAEAEIIMDASLDVICQIDEHGIFTKVSAACKELWGYEKHELVGKPYIDFIIEEDVEKTNESASEILSGKSLTTFENRYKRKDGGIAFNLWSVRYDPKSKYLFGIARDAKEKIKKEELLNKSEQRFKALVQEGSDLIAILDEAGIYTYVSPTSMGILGMAPEEFIGKSPFDYIHPEDAEKALNSLSKITSESRVEVEPFRFKNKDSEWRWIETVLTNMLDNPSVKGIVANSRDITETKNIFNKIAANDQFNRAVLESSPDCLKILDNEGRLMYMNFNGLCQMEIDDFSEVKNKQWGLLWGPENEALVRESVDKALMGETAQFTAFCPTAKGTPKWWDVMVSPVIRAGEPIEKIISVSRDITNQKVVDKKLAESESFLNEAQRLAKMGNWNFDFRSDKLTWSDELYNVFDTDNKTFLETYGSFVHLIDESDRPLVLKTSKHAQETGESFNIQYRITTEKGEKRIIEEFGYGEKDNHGNVIRLFGTAQNITQRWNSEISLKQSEARLRAIISSQTNYIIRTDMQGNYSYCNQKFIDDFGWIHGTDNTSLIGINCMISIMPYHHQNVINIVEKCCANPNQIFQIEIDKPADNNRVKTTLWEFILLTDSEGKPDEVQCTGIDITQRKIANEEIAKSEEKIRLIMNGALDAIITIDTKETITFWNAQAEVIFGWKAEEVMGKPLSETIIPESFRKYHIEGLKNYLKTGEGKALNVLLELSAIRRNREEFPIELTVIPIKQGGEEFFCAFIRDITQRKKAEREIKQANERFEKATEATNDVIWDWDLENATMFRSNAIDNFFGVGTSKVLVNKDFWNDNFHKEDIPKIKSSMQKALEDPDCNRWEEEYRINNNNEIFFIIDRGLILRNKNGKAIRMVGAMTNITEQKIQERKLIELNQSLNEQAAELKRSNEELEQFAYITSHDLQEPLRMISSFMDQLKRKYADSLDEKGLQYIHFATDGAIRMKQIILDLLEYSRAGKIQEKPQKIDVKIILDEYIILRRKLIAEKNAVFQVEKLPIITTYNTPLVQVFHNLIDNAIKYSKNDQNSVVKISCIDQNTFWEFCIEDNGIGIDDKFFSKIFVIFQRLHDRDNYSGTGIGLSIVKKQVESLGGKIWIESKVNVGSKIYFTIPK